MKSSKELKDIVKSKYGEIATKSSCCCSDEADYTIMSDDYQNIEGYNPDADLSLGCGIPTDLAEIKEGDSVLDLGSGAGNDCFVARALVGDSGQVTGLDFTDEMLRKANLNVEKLGFTNVSFIKGDIENMPIEDSMFDVIISNCVLNLVPDKKKAFAEISRVLKDGGHFCVSDIVLEGDLPQNLKNAATAYAGCVSGAVQKKEYLEIIQNNKFKSIEIKKTKSIKLPDDLLLKYISTDELTKFRESGTGVFSITVFAKK